MPDWTDNLRELDLAACRPFYDELAGHERAAAIELQGDRRHSRRAERRTFEDARRVANAARHLERIPAPGESVHMVVAGEYSLWHLIPAVLQLAAPATFRYLGIATLGFSRANLEDLLAMLDRGQVARCDFLYSVYFKSNEREICERLAHELKHRGQRVLAMRTHAKLLLLELTDGQALTVESSANLRSCKNIEQAVFTHDRGLLEFHRQWLAQLFEENATA